MHPRKPRKNAGRTRGFTLVEAILVIVIIGVLGAIVAMFIRAPVQGYVDTAARAAASDEADLASRRIARDLRLSLPNSVRVSSDGSAVEFLLTKTGGRYLTLDDDVDAYPVLDFDNPGQPRFTVVGGTVHPILPGEFIVVYNTGAGDNETDAYQYAPGRMGINIARVQAVSDPASARPVVTMEGNPFATQANPMRSPSDRFQVVTGPVTYACEPGGQGGNELVRYWGYPIAPAQHTPPQGERQRAVIAARVADCSQVFRYGSDATRRSALVILNLALRAGNDGGALVRLASQVHVDNTP